MSFFRVLHEASSSWLKFVHAFQKHPVERSNCVKNQKIISPYENRSNKSCSMINHFAAPSRAAAAFARSPTVHFQFSNKQPTPSS
jgi:hypothetical protein